MTSIDRRSLIKAAGAAAVAMPFINHVALGDEPLKVGLVYLGPIGDYGWTWAHEKARKEMVAAMGGRVTADYVENVNEDQSAIPVIRDLAKSGHKLIFTTSFGYMDQTIQVAGEFPDVKFEHCTGYKHAPNVATYNNRFYQARAVMGAISGMMSKTGVIGYLGSFKVPEVVMGVDAYALSAQAMNPKIKVKLVMIDTWLDPAKEAAAAETLTNLGCDFVTTHTDSPAALQVLEKKKLYGFGQGADMSRFAPHACLTSILDIWSPYYISRAKAVLDGTWKSGDSWWGVKEGSVQIAPFNKDLPANVKAAGDKIMKGWKDGSYEVFTGPMVDQSGKERLAKGVRMEDKDLAVIDWYVNGVEG
ncbi:MAG: BMP family ABC transporter substrate-binding protein [Roseiarcus sp.]